MKLKRCSKCGEEKPREDFYRDRERPDGRQPKCKTCHEAASKSWRERNRERVRARKRLHRKTHPGDSPSYKERHSEKVRARWTLANAVHEGRLAKPDQCEGCGELTDPVDLHGHHRDYSKPLAVEWLCRGCHQKQHNKD